MNKFSIGEVEITGKDIDELWRRLEAVDEVEVEVEEDLTTISQRDTQTQMCYD